jgi:membrane protease YdiL (CAAX protease family)
MEGGALRRAVRAHPFLSYYGVALLICASAVVWQSIYGAAWSAANGGAEFNYNEHLWAGLRAFMGGSDRMYANVISIGWVAATRESVFFNVFLLGGAPTISALLITAIGWGRPGLLRLVSRLKPWPSRAFRGDALRAYAILFVVLLAVSLFHVALMWKILGPAQALERASFWGLPAWLLPLSFFFGGFIDEGGSNEELGWRGFALPTLLSRMQASPLTVALVLGFLWWAWHFPREVPDIVAGKVVWPSFIQGQFIFLVLVVALSVGMTFFYHRTGGSVISAVVIHGWTNFLTKGVSLWHVVKLDDRTWLCVGVAVLLVAIYGRDLGRRRFLELGGADSMEP